MDQENLGAEEDFEMTVENTSTDPKQRYFHQVIMQIQQIILEEEFQSAQHIFMAEHCDQDIKSAAQAKQLFKLYKNNIAQLLISKIKSQIPNFNIEAFCNELKHRTGQVDEQIQELILSCVDIEFFQALLNDYRTAQQQQERYRVLTIKTNKVPENKKVKGNNQNIFGASSVPTFGSKVPTKKPSAKISEKSLEQLLVPETILTVKGLRKG